ncbi:hypothetical protein R8Z50_23045 [Longispora sp. K20-0274]|uniref:hypothetical protein n=1 Tax=Longispora sp. K20-0274 TaxID=3088255 RepID=UPI00399A6958
MTDGVAQPRPLTDRERAVLAKLLTVEFPGAADLRAQLPHTRVAGCCTCGCATVTLAVDASVAAPAAVTSGAPVSADVSDDDQDAGIVLLVDDAGYLSCLEIYSIGDPVGEFPAVEWINPYPAR